MKIETKYDLDQQVFFVRPEGKTLQIDRAVVWGITISKDGINYFMHHISPSNEVLKHNYTAFEHENTVVPDVETLCSKIRDFYPCKTK